MKKRWCVEGGSGCGGREGRLMKGTSEEGT